MSTITDQLQSLYTELDRLKGSGEDVVASIRAEINNLELEYLNKEVFPNIAKTLGSKLATLRCEIDFSLQFNGADTIDYSFCTSGSSIMMRDSVECANCTSMYLNENTYTAISDNVTLPKQPINVYYNDVVEEDFEYCNEKPSSYITTRKKHTNEEYKVYLVPYSDKTFALYEVPDKLHSALKYRGGYLNKKLRNGTGWIFTKKKEAEIRAFLIRNSVLIIDGEPSGKPTAHKPAPTPKNDLISLCINNKSTQRSQSYTKTSSKPKEDPNDYRDGYIKFIKKINNDESITQTSEILESCIKVLESDAFLTILVTYNRTNTIYDIHDYVYMPRLMRISDSKLPDSDYKENLKTALKYYHRFLYFKINGRDIEV